MLMGEHLKDFFIDIVKEECDAIETSLAHFKTVHDWDFEELNKQISDEFNFKIKKADFIASNRKLSAYLFEAASSMFDQKINELPEGVFLDVCRTIFLQSLDTLWKEHLKNLDYLKEGVGLRGYAQVNPLVEYKKEAFNMFVELDYNIKMSTLGKLVKVKVSPQYAEAEGARQAEAAEDERKTAQMMSSLEQYKKQQEALQKNLIMSRSSDEAPQPVKRTHDKVGRNDLCPCGSGKKYKKCCGK